MVSNKLFRFHTIMHVSNKMKSDHFGRFEYLQLELHRATILYSKVLKSKTEWYRCVRVRKLIVLRSELLMDIQVQFQTVFNLLKKYLKSETSLDDKSTPSFRIGICITRMRYRKVANETFYFGERETVWQQRGTINLFHN